MPAVVEQLLAPQCGLISPNRLGTGAPDHSRAFLRFDGTDTVLAEDGAEILTTAVDEVLRMCRSCSAHDTPSSIRMWM